MTLVRGTQDLLLPEFLAYFCFVCVIFLSWYGNLLMLAIVVGIELHH